MFSKWTNRKKLAGCLLVSIGFLGALSLFLSIDGMLHERRNDLAHLLNMHTSWVLDGAPWPVADAHKYGYSNVGTAYVYTASHTINGHVYQGLFAYQRYGRPTVFAIMTNGVCLVLREDGSARRLRTHK